MPKYCAVLIPTWHTAKDYPLPLTLTPAHRTSIVGAIKVDWILTDDTTLPRAHDKSSFLILKSGSFDESAVPYIYLFYSAVDEFRKGVERMEEMRKSFERSATAPPTALERVIATSQSAPIATACSWDRNACCCAKKKM